MVDSPPPCSGHAVRDEAKRSGGTPSSSASTRLPARPDPPGETLAGHATVCKTCRRRGDWPTWRRRWCQLASAWRAPLPRSRCSASRGGELPTWTATATLAPPPSPSQRGRGRQRRKRADGGDRADDLRQARPGRPTSAPTSPPLWTLGCIDSTLVSHRDGCIPVPLMPHSDAIPRVQTMWKILGVFQTAGQPRDKLQFISINTAETSANYCVVYDLASKRTDSCVSSPLHRHRPAAPPPQWQQRCPFLFITLSSSVTHNI